MKHILLVILLTVAYSAGFGQACLDFKVETTSTKSCIDANTGTIRLKVLNGTGPYTIKWNDGSDKWVRTRLGAGNYKVKVTDAHGCKTSGSVKISTHSSFTVNPQTVSNNDKSEIRLSTSGGEGPYTFIWLKDGKKIKNSSRKASGQPGTYNAIVIDKNNCTQSIKAKIE